MLITPHSVAGATIAALVPHPAAAIPLAVVSHFVMDSIPHWQEILYPYHVTWKTWLRIPFDIALAVTLVSLIIQANPQHQTLIILSALAANAPDADSIAIVWKKTRNNKLLNKFFVWHCNIQKETASHWGVVTQILLCELCLAFSL